MTVVKRLAILLLIVAGCRTVSPVRELETSTVPDISRLILRDGKVIAFNRDFGWYNKQEGTIEGVDTAGQHVVYHLAEVNKVETVRAYAIIPLVLTVGIAIAVGVYLIAKLLTFAQFL